MIPIAVLLRLLTLGQVAFPTDARPALAASPQVVAPAGVAAVLRTLPGREADERAAAIAFRIATAGLARCPVVGVAAGLVLQHLSQFHPADRAGIVAALPLDRGPGVIVVVEGGPAEQAGIQAGDILLGVDDTPFPPEPGLTTPFDAAVAQARADTIDDRLAAGGLRPTPLTMLRDGATRTVELTQRPACPSQVRVARSEQRNAYADGHHVFLTTGLLARLRNDDELAFVIAHEMAHNILGHAAVMRGGSVRRGLGRTLGRSGAIVRDTERAADRLAGELMLDAGFDPVAGVEMLRRLGGADLGIALLAAHAPVGERIAAMRTLVADRTPAGAPAR